MKTKKKLSVKTYNIHEVCRCENLLNRYLKDLNNCIKDGSVTIKDTINYARSICGNLPSYEDITLLNTDKFINDKGITGKILEYALFGQKPNCDSSPDLINLNTDIKSCSFKSIKNGKNAKERLTLTNCGNTNNYETFENIIQNENFTDSKYYLKCKKFILFIRDYEKKVFETFDEILNQKMCIIIDFNIDNLPIEMKNIINDDYKSIRNRIINKDVSQAGQKYLHIHPHGAGHGSGNRALGYTSKFITQIVAHSLSDIYKKSIDEILITKGKSITIDNIYI